ncbi:MAG: septum formation initiator family protein [Candidatus Omnitrophica bacterium]|nr:septum formation initiator family protein [Candidatus Omnitrophota bacterium]
MSRHLYAILFFAAVVAFLAIIYLPSYTKYQELKQEDEKIAEHIQELQTQNDQLREEARLLQTDVKYLEKVLREELGLVKPGEVVYKFVKDEKKKS